MKTLLTCLIAVCVFAFTHALPLQAEQDSSIHTAETAKKMRTVVLKMTGMT